jgi:Ca2+-binding RTX toxin-like protein
VPVDPNTEGGLNIYSYDRSDSNTPTAGVVVAGSVITGSSGGDILTATSGHPIIYGGAGADTLFGSGGEDKLYGERGPEVIYGRGGADRVLGNKGDDRLFGNRGADKIKGGSGDDLLKGGSGADKLKGNGGDDKLKGGGGADTFTFNDGHDRIEEFSIRSDHLKPDDKNWHGQLSAAQVVNRYAFVQDGDTVFDFGGNDQLTLTGITNLDALAAVTSIL